MENEKLEQEEQEEVAEHKEEVVEIDPEVEERASLYGWTSKDNFKGDPAKWVSADIFVKRADEILPIARAMNRKLESDLKSTNAELAELRKTMKAVIKTHEKISQETFNTMVNQIKKDQVQAVIDGDVEAWQKLEDTKEKLSGQKPEVVEFEEKSEVGQANPVVVQWKKDNPWYETDPELGIYADSIASFISTRSPGLPPEEFLKKVKDEVKSRFPNKFSNQKRQASSSIDRSDFGGGDNGSSGKKTYSDLPADAKAACNEMIKQKIITKEKYVQTYFEEE